MFKLISSIFIKDYQNINSYEVKQRYINFHSIISIIISIVFIVYKLYYAFMFNSITLLGDGIESITNIISALLIAISYKISASKESVEHPFGRGRILYIANFIIAFLLIFTGYEIAKIAIENLVYGREWPAFTNSVFYVIGFSILANEWLTFYAYYIAKKIKSPLMKSEAKHRRSDTWLSLGVLVSWYGSQIHMPWIDSLGGIIFAILIFKSAYMVAKDSIKDLLGQKPSEEELNQITQIALSVNDVWDIHEIIIHSYGHKKVVSFHVEIDEELSLRDSHFICDNIERKIQEQTGFLCITHTDPINLSQPFLKDVSLYIKNAVRTHPILIKKITNVRDINIQNKTITCDIYIRKILTPAAQQSVIDVLTTIINNNFQSDYLIKAYFRPIVSTNFNVSIHKNSES